MLVCQLVGVSKEWDGKPLFEQVNMELREGQRVCLIGRNGVGKTTLLAGIMNQLSFDTGNIHRGVPLIDWGWLEQTLTMPDTVTLRAFVESGSAMHAEALTELRKVEAQLSAKASNHDSDIDERLLWAYGEAQDRFTQMAGYAWEAAVTRCLMELELNPATWQVPYEALSGGQKTRAQIARLVVKQPKVVVLDEPTNHLDTDTLLWLENWMTHYRGTVLFVSHDRAFIDHVATDIVELSANGARHFRGHYTAYRDQVALERATQQALYDKQQRERRELQEAIARYRQWFQTAHAAAGERNPFMKKRANKNMTRFRAKEQALARLESQQVERPGHQPAFHMAFDDSGFQAPAMLSLHDVSFGYGPQVLFKGLNMRIRRGDKVALIGRNGVGKSTLLKLITGLVRPSQGEVVRHPQLRIGYFAQELEALDRDSTILDSLLNQPGMTVSHARTILASFLFPKDDVFKRIGDLSMGERCRVAFVNLYFSGANLLVLDEPTNYLDVDARERVEAWLEAYPGAVIVVSHDRYLIQRVANRVLAIDQGLVTDYPDRLDMYEQHNPWV